MPACRQCSSEMTQAWFKMDRGVIYRCGDLRCGVGFLHPQPSAEQLDSFYDEFYYPEHGGVGVHENSTRWKSIQHFEALDSRLGLQGQDVLDYGCGVGNFMAVAQERGARVSGVEFDDTGRSEAIARGFGVEKSIAGYAPNSFDVVYMNDVIEHLRDPAVELRSVRDALRPGGSLFVVTMNMNSLKRHLKRDKWDVITNPTHLWFYDDSSLAATLRMADFTRVETQHWPVKFDHHGRIRETLQRGLQATGLDASLRVVAQTS